MKRHLHITIEAETTHCAVPFTGPRCAHFHDGPAGRSCAVFGPFGKAEEGFPLRLEACRAAEIKAVTALLNQRERAEEFLEVRLAQKYAADHVRPGETAVEALGRRLSELTRELAAVRGAHHLTARQRDDYRERLEAVERALAGKEETK